MSNIYYTEIIDAKQLNEEDISKNYEKAKIDHGPNWNMSYEEFKEHIHSWGEDLYKFDRWINSYHLDMATAIDYVVNNIADVNESGAYNYAAIVKAPCDHAYYNIQIDKDSDIMLFKYNRETNKYEELEKDDPIYMPMLYNVWGIAYTENQREEER